MLCKSRHSDLPGVKATDDAELLIVAEEEGAIADDRPADASAKLVLTPTGFWDGLSEFVGTGVEDVVAEELICRAVQSVGAGFGDDVDDGSGGPSHLGGEGVGLDVDLLNGVDGGSHADRSDDALVVVHAVDELIVDYVGLSVDGDGGGLTAVVGTVAAGETVVEPFGCSGDDLHEIDVVAAVEREILRRLFCDGAAEDRGVGVEGRSLRFDLDDLIGSADVEMGVFTGAIAGGEIEGCDGGC